MHCTVGFFVGSLALEKEVSRIQLLPLPLSLAHRTHSSPSVDAVTLLGFCTCDDHHVVFQVVVTSEWPQRDIYLMS